MLNNVIAGSFLSVLAVLPALAEEPILTIDLGDGDMRSFSAEALRSFPETSFDTTTIWTEGKVTFTGVELKALLDSVGITEGNLKATAINDYSVEIPVSDAVEDGPIVAYTRDGQEMSVRDKGPLWIVYPYDSNADYQTEVIYSRSIWQLNRISAQQ